MVGRGAGKDGVYVEPASAASVAGLLDAHANGELESGQTVVCTVTGNGLKDPDTAIGQCQSAVVKTIDARLDQVRDSILQAMSL